MIKIGLRLKTRGHLTAAEVEKLDSRFGMTKKVVLRIAKQLGSSFSLVMLHGNGAKYSDLDGFVSSYYLETFRELQQLHPSLHYLNIGGGMDAYFTDEQVRRCISISLRKILRILPKPSFSIFSEFGKYTSFSHSCLIMKVVGVKQNGSCLPWYILNGSIMNLLPDSWALGELFLVIPLNNQDSPPRHVRLAGMTCDEDDVYPPHGSTLKLMLPMRTEGLLIGIFGVGAYEEMLSGFGGLQHCSIPHPTEFIYRGRVLSPLATPGI